MTQRSSYVNPGRGKTFYPVIIFRYLSKEVLFATIAVSGVLLLIIMSGRFVSFLADAASGKFAADVLFTIMGYQLPSFLELILPLGLFVAILLAHGRLYMDSEMTVLIACGLSQGQLLLMTLAPALVVAVAVGVLSLEVSPAGKREVYAIYTEQRERNEFDALVPGRFQSLGESQGTIYAEDLSADRTTMTGVFIAESASDQPDDRGLVTMRAASGEQQLDPDSGRRYLVLSDGVRYEGMPGEEDYREIVFQDYGQLLPDQGLGGEVLKKDALTTTALWRSDDPEQRALLHWRLSLPVSVLVVAILAVPLARTNPRQGRYAKMIPAILLYIVYLVALNFARGLTEDGAVGGWLIWLMHGVFLAIAALLFSWPALRRWQAQRRAAPGQGQGQSRDEVNDASA